jgi:hypothetical protein
VLRTAAMRPTPTSLALAYRLPDGWKFARITQARTGHQSNQKILFKDNGTLPLRLPNRLNRTCSRHRRSNIQTWNDTILLALSLVQVDSAKNKITRDAHPRAANSELFSRGSKALNGLIPGVCRTSLSRYTVGAVLLDHAVSGN